LLPFFGLTSKLAVGVARATGPGEALLPSAPRVTVPVGVVFGVGVDATPVVPGGV
jgi:hypothetical protein